VAVGRNLLGKYPVVVWVAKLVAGGNCLIHTEEEAEVVEVW